MKNNLKIGKNWINIKTNFIKIYNYFKNIFVNLKLFEFLSL